MRHLFWTSAEIPLICSPNAPRDPGAGSDAWAIDSGQRQHTVVAGTNRNLREMVAQGEFRRILLRLNIGVLWFHRYAIVRGRPGVARLLHALYARHYRREEATIGPAVRSVLTAYAWRQRTRAGGWSNGSMPRGSMPRC